MSLDPTAIVISEEWIRKKLNINHENLDEIKSLSLPGTYQEKISHLGSSLSKFLRLKELDLSRNALVSLEGLENAKNLEKLNLYYNNITSLKDLERLKYNPALSELDLRLNPITKEENDYRLFLIHILPSLKVLDDRSIRESERQMAIAYFGEPTNLMPREIEYNPTKTNNYDQYNNNNINNHHHHNNNHHQTNNAIMSRCKSVSNIAKRSAGINDLEADEDNFHNILNLKMHEASNGMSNDDQENNGYYTQKNDEFASKAHKELGNFASQSHSLFVTNNINHRTNQIDGKDANFARSKSYSMQNLRSIGTSSEPQNNNLNFADESEAFTNYKSRGNFTANPYYEQQEIQTVEKQIKSSQKPRRSSDDFDNENEQIVKNDDTKSNPLFLLLDLVDRYWNGSKSLHKNFKFLGAANQLLAQYKLYSGEHNIYEDQMQTMQTQFRVIQEENKRLQQQMMMVVAKSNGNVGKHVNVDNESSSELYVKNLLQEIDILKKKLINCQEENKRLRKEVQEKNDKIEKHNSIDTIENENGSMKRDIEIMRIKLKQYEQLQQLTTMLQESHKSLVTTNEHLLQEINSHKKETRSNNNLIANSRYSIAVSDLNLYSPSHAASTQQHDSVHTSNTTSSNASHYGQSTYPKPTIKKQFEQLNSNLNTRYSYSYVK